jgi:hypothetical protein
MPEIAFAPFAEDFIEAVGTFLSEFGLSVKLRKEIAGNQSRIYDVEAPDGPVEIFFHRTARSISQPNPEYRARVIAKTTPEFAEFARDKDTSRWAPADGLTCCNSVHTGPIVTPMLWPWKTSLFAARPCARSTGKLLDLQNLRRRNICLRGTKNERRIIIARPIGPTGHDTDL